MLDAQAAANLRRLQALEERARRARIGHDLGEDAEADMDGMEAAPLFLTRPRESYRLGEGRNVHFEAKLTPITDANLKVEWLKDGQPVTVGHRFRPIHDFGYVALDILGLIEEDSGTYTCRATNLSGQAQIQTLLEVKSKRQMTKIQTIECNMILCLIRFLEI